MKKNIYDLTFDGLKKEISAMGEPSHRARQIFKWLYEKTPEASR